LGEQNIVMFYLDLALGYLKTPLGVAAMMVMIVYVAYVLFGKGGKWVAVTMLLTTGITGIEEQVSTQTVLIPALEMFRSSGRALFTVTLVLLLLRMVIGEGQTWRREGIPKSVMALCGLQVMYGIGWIVQGVIPRGVGSIALSLLLVGGLAGMVGKGCRSLGDVRSIFRAAEVSGLLFGAMSLLQLSVNANAAYFLGRFAGISANPQYAAIFMSILVNIAIYMAGTPTEVKFLRIAHYVCAVIFAAFMMWTGSRTGFVILVVGLTVQLHLRPWLLLTAGAGGLLAMRLLTSVDEYAVGAMGRLVSSEDTGRGRIFVQAYEYFLRYPVFGRATVVMENCYLAVASCTGLVGLAFLAMVGIFHFQSLFFVWQNRRVLGQERRIVDLLVAWSLALLGASMFEGFVLAIATAAIVFVILLLSMTGMVKEYIEITAENAQLEGYPVDETAIPSMG